MCYAKVGVCGNPLEACLYGCFYVFNFPFNFLISGLTTGFASDFGSQTVSLTTFTVDGAVTAVPQSHSNELITT